MELLRLPSDGRKPVRRRRRTSDEHTETCFMPTAARVPVAPSLEVPPDIADMFRR
jgi:hypothetical protein